MRIIIDVVGDANDREDYLDCIEIRKEFVNSIKFEDDNSGDKINEVIDSFWINNYDDLKHDRNLMFTSLKAKFKEAFT